MRKIFDEELKNVTEEVIKMANGVDSMLTDVIAALQNKDLELATEIVFRDDVIDEEELRIEELCIDIMATQFPIARDLRRITTILRMISDLERIADHSVNIAKVVLENEGNDFSKQLIDLPRMQMICSNMISDAIQCFIEEDVDLAIKIIHQDDEVDNIYDTIYQELLEMMSESKVEEDNSFRNQSVMLLLIGRYLERIADHTTNIAERVVYMVTGNIYT